MKPVYLADSGGGASAEVLARKKRLGGASQISLERYPRVIYTVDVTLDHVIRLARKPRNPVLASVWTKSLDADIAYSQEVGPVLATAGIQEPLFRSTIGTSMNLIVFLDNCDSSQLKVCQLDETMDTFKQISQGVKRKRFSKPPEWA